MPLKEKELQVYPLLPSTVNPSNDRHPVKLGYANSTFAKLAGAGQTLSNTILAADCTASTAAAGDNSTKIATTAFVQTAVTNAANGIEWKDPVQYATTAGLSATYDNGTGTLTASANGALSVDGASPVVGDRILVKDQAASAQNGIYRVTDAGSATTPFVLTRAADFDATTEMQKMTFVAVQYGNTNIGKLYYMSATSVVVIGTDPIMWTQFTMGTTYTASQGVQLVGSDFRLNLKADGGLAITSDQAHILLPANSGLAVDASGLYIATGGVAPAMLKGRYYTDTHAAVSTPGASGYYELGVNHNTGFQYGLIQVIRASDGSRQDVAVEWTNANAFTLGFSESVEANEFIIMYLGLA